MVQLLTDAPTLVNHILNVLHERSNGEQIYHGIDSMTAAAVLLLVSFKSCNDRGPGGPCLILNKRSLKVKQPGDLCCPGGSVAPFVDPLIARFLSLPFLSLGRWRYWHHWNRRQSPAARILALFWATGLRESFEEMRLNPFGVRFLGPLPPQSLVMFQRTIYPLVALIDRQKRFFPNWEVEKVVGITLRDLLTPANYVRYRIKLNTSAETESADTTRHFPCFRIQSRHNTELLWGATYRIVTLFLDYIFGFKPPGLEEIPTIDGALDQNYLTGHH